MNALKKTVVLLTILWSGHAIPAASEPTQVSLPDYAFDFPTYGYEITVTGEAVLFSGRLTGDAYFTIRDKGYNLKTLIDHMSRTDRKRFISFFNDHCIVGFGAQKCYITASGEVELDEDMRMVFHMSDGKINIGGNDWSSSNWE